MRSNPPASSHAGSQETPFSGKGPVGVDELGVLRGLADSLVEDRKGRARYVFCNSELRLGDRQSETICDHSIPNRFKYFLNLSASFVIALRPRETLKSLRPASESERESRQI
jgi:hypothetical protein